MKALNQFPSKAWISKVCLLKSELFATRLSAFICVSSSRQPQRRRRSSGAHGGGRVHPALHVRHLPRLPGQWGRDQAARQHADRVRADATETAAAEVLFPDRLLGVAADALLQMPRQAGDSDPAGQSRVQVSLMEVDSGLVCSSKGRQGGVSCSVVACTSVQRKPTELKEIKLKVNGTVRPARLLLFWISSERSPGALPSLSENTERILQNQILQKHHRHFHQLLPDIITY